MFDSHRSTKKSSDTVEKSFVNPALVPKMVDAWLEITALGLRSLTSVEHQHISTAHVAPQGIVLNESSRVVR